MTSPRPLPVDPDDLLRQFEQRERRASLGVDPDRLLAQFNQQAASESTRRAVDEFGTKKAGAPTRTIGEDAAWVAGNVANIAQGIPGMEAAEAGVSALVNRMPYRQALDAIREETGKIPWYLKLPEQAIGGAALATSSNLPNAVNALSATKAGALYGGASQLLNADDDLTSAGGLVKRGVKTGAGAVLGGALGRLSEMVGTGVKALRAPSSTDQLKAAVADRAKSARDLYAIAEQEGVGKEATASIDGFLAEPDIQPIVERLQGLREYRDMDPRSFTFLDAIYNDLSDQQRVVQKQLGALVPGRPNTNRAGLRDISAAKQQLLDAMEAPGQRVEPAVLQHVPAPETAQSPPPSLRDALARFQDQIREGAERTVNVPIEAGNVRISGRTTAAQQVIPALRRHEAEQIVATPLSGAPAARTIEVSPEQVVDLPPVSTTYRTAVEDYAKRSRAIDAMGRGHDAVLEGSSPTIPRAKALLKRGEPGLEEYLHTASPEDVENVRRGILGVTRDAVTRHPGNPLRAFPQARHSLSTAASLMARTGQPTLPPSYLAALLAALTPQ